MFSYSRKRTNSLSGTFSLGCNLEAMRVLSKTNDSDSNIV